MTPVLTTPARVLGTLTLCATLAACSNTDDLPVREGPQAVHPSPSKLAQNKAFAAATPTAATTKETAAKGDLADTLFAEFCIGKSAAQSEQALVASGRFAEPSITEFKNIGARYASFALNSHDRASVTVVTGSIGGLQCSVGVNNKGPNLYEDGRVSRSG